MTNTSTMIQASVPGIELKQFVNSKHGFYAGLTWMFGDGDHYEHTEFVIESIQFVRETVENYKKLRADIAALMRIGKTGWMTIVITIRSSVNQGLSQCSEKSSQIKCMKFGNLGGIA